MTQEERGRKEKKGKTLSASNCRLEISSTKVSPTEKRGKKARNLSLASDCACIWPRPTTEGERKKKKEKGEKGPP